MSRDLDGTTGAIDWGDIAALKITSQTLTVCCWINPDSVSGVRSLFGSNDWNANSGLRGFRLALNGQFLRYSKLGVVDISGGAGITVSTGAWQFIAIAAVSGSNDFYKIATDKTVTTANSNNSQALLTGTTQHVIAGARGNGSSAYTDRLDGRIAEVACWIGTKLTQAQLLAAAFAGPLACGAPPPTFYAPHWGAGADEPQLSGLGVVGTVAGTAPQANHAPVGCPFPLAA